ncbi:hypothetical protein [Gandjariella thermophila]|uniref:Uncharacterized protein n=1 Tax=Gandjariella thermophila TaxID=1931992 RepID=A0A4D4JBD7_9PSEU|nr:hypothetical protein [Gandjariella thermophila]GDY31153.1 hypothetical protein GTS_27860 [Gandjariella thermophila]
MSDDASRSPLRVFGAVALVTLLYAASTLAWWLWGRNSATASDIQPAYRIGKAAEPLEIGDIGGAPENVDRVRSLSALADRDDLTSAELGAYQDGEGSDVRIAVSDYPEGKAVVVLVRLADAQHARRTEQELVALQHGYGLTDLSASRPGVAVLGPGRDGAPLERAVYRHGDVVARIEFRGSDPAAVYTRMAGVLDAELRALPADAWVAPEPGVRGRPGAA